MGLDVVLINGMLKSLGISWKKLGEKAEVCRSTIAALKNNQKNRNQTLELGAAISIARVLGVRLEDILLNDTDVRHYGWETLQPTESVFERFGDLARDAKVWLTYSKCIHTYFLSDPMHEWFQRRAFKKQGWTDERIETYSQGHKKSSDIMLDHHKDSTQLHVLLLREDVFKEAAKENLGYIADTLKIVKDLGVGSCISLKTSYEWNQIRGRIEEAREISSYCSIAVFDDVLCVTRPQCGGEMRATTDPVEVQKMRNLLFPVGVRLPPLQDGWKALEKLTVVKKSQS
ncbi:MAG: hypothetical protein JWM11_4928 [Planctomycetaceae bacterium]|nr:hypothetical protein [Planctomycetaceae bacterium]